MVESLILFLIYLCLLVACVYLVMWVCGQLGIPLPANVIKIFWVIVALIAILLLWRMVGPSLSGARLPGLR